MDFIAKSSAVATLKTDCLILPIFQDGQLSPSAKAVDSSCKGAIKQVLKLGDFKGKAEQTLPLNLNDVAAKRVILLGCGDPEKLNENAYKKILTSMFKSVKGTASKDAALYLGDIQVGEREAEWHHAYATETIEWLSYKFDEYKSKKKEAKDNPLKKISWVGEERVSASLKNAVTQGLATAVGANFARDLGNTPGNVCHPTFLANNAKSLGQKYAKLTVKVIDEKQLEKMGMGCFMSVSRGSEQPGKLIIMEHKGGKVKDAPHVIVGKGITFDTGGISLKPGAGMDEMKYDMCGAASVFGTMKAISEMDLKLNVIGVVAAAENMPSGRASRPGDIVTSLSGQTVEILNTDAEGRLVLCDALTYVERFKPASVIDIATLTGACIVALGAHPCAMLSNDDDLASQLIQAGQTAHDRCWQLPLWDDYHPQLDSPFADMANIGGPKAGTITAACFLSKFTKAYKWAHLDIAGVAWESGANKCASGRPVPLLTQYLMQQL